MLGTLSFLLKKAKTQHFVTQLSSVSLQEITEASRVTNDVQDESSTTLPQERNNDKGHKRDNSNQIACVTESDITYTTDKIVAHKDRRHKKIFSKSLVLLGNSYDSQPSSYQVNVCLAHLLGLVIRYLILDFVILRNIKFNFILLWSKRLSSADHFWNPSTTYQIMTCQIMKQDDISTIGRSANSASKLKKKSNSPLMELSLAECSTRKSPPAGSWPVTLMQTLWLCKATKFALMNKGS